MSTIGDQLGHSASFTDVVFKCIDKLFLGFEGVYIRDVGIETDKELSTGDAAVKSWCVGVHSVGCNRLTTTNNIEGGVD